MRSDTPQRRRWVRLALAGLLAVATAAIGPISGAHADEQTISVNALRDGWDPHEPALSGLTPTDSDFGERFDVALRGQIYAQPLVIDAHGSTPATLIVATESDFVYGLNPANGHIRWADSLGPPWPPATVGCGNITTRIGVTSTPVYDPATGAVYVMAKTNGHTASGAADPQHPFWRLHALDAGNGKELKGWPVTISGYPDNDPMHAFNSETVAQRPGLLLMDGVIYAGFASYCDVGPFDGYVAGINATTHRITSLWTTAAGTDNGWAGVWQSGAGLMSDGDGRIFVTTGNGNGTAPGAGPGTSPPPRLSESVIRLGVARNGAISARDFFSPTNNASLDAGDLDLGSGGPVALPKPVAGKRLLVQIGKDGRAFLLDRDNLGGMAQGPGGTDAAVAVSGPFRGVWGHPAYWGGPGNSPTDGGYLYDVENLGPLRAFHVSTDAAGNPALTPVAASTGVFGYTSGSPIITSSAATSGSAVIWVVFTKDLYGRGGDLRAYDALPDNGTLDELYSSATDSAVSFTAEKFTTAAADGNRVYFGTYDGHVLSFGEASTPAITSPPTDCGSVAVGSASDPRTVTITALRRTQVSGITVSGPFSADPPSLPHTLDAGQSLTLPVTFHPAAPGPASGDLAVTSHSGRVDHLDLSGVGTEPGFTSAPPSVAFDSVPTGSRKTVNVEIANTGISDESIASVELDQTDKHKPFSVPTGLTGTTIHPGQSIAIPVTYAPRTGAAASDTASLTVSAATGTVAVTSLSATAITGRAQLFLRPNPLHFRGVDMGTSQTKSFALHNTGNIPLTFSKAGPPAGDFVANSPLPEGTTLQPGQAIREQITYTPTRQHPPPATYYFNFSDGTGKTHPPQVEAFRGHGIDVIANYYAKLGGRHSFLGRPWARERSVGAGRVRKYEHGRIYWSTATGAHALHGRVLRHYLVLGGPAGFAGFPLSDVHRTADRNGVEARFAGSNAVIVYRKGLGAYEVNGAIRAKWTSLGGVISSLGYPTSDEFGTPSGKRRSNFQHGHITWNPRTHRTTVTET